MTAINKTANEIIIEAILVQLDDGRGAYMRFDKIKAAAEKHGISKGEVDTILIVMREKNEIVFKMGNPGKIEDKTDIVKADDQIYTHCTFE